MEHNRFLKYEEFVFDHPEGIGLVFGGTDEEYMAFRAAFLKKYPQYDTTANSVMFNYKRPLLGSPKSCLNLLLKRMKTRDREKLIAAMKRMECYFLADRAPYSLSLGQRERVQAALDAVNGKERFFLYLFADNTWTALTLHQWKGRPVLITRRMTMEDLYRDPCKGRDLDENDPLLQYKGKPAAEIFSAFYELRDGGVFVHDPDLFKHNAQRAYGAAVIQALLFSQKGEECYKNGNYEKALEYFLEATEQGLADAQKALATLKTL